MLKAIETEYRGFRFRSRSEARHAVFLDCLRIRWTYEAQGYNLGRDCLYLPDFDLIDIGCWLEIKGPPPTASEKRKAVALSSQAGKPVVIFHGEISPRMVGDIATTGYHPDNYSWAACSVCGKVEIIDILAFRSVDCRVCKRRRLFRATTTALRQAYIAARSARFEFGETPVLA
jgi:DNA-directed RNA polymerase subunit RPC12/RpoP